MGVSLKRPEFVQQVSDAASREERNRFGRRWSKWTKQDPVRGQIRTYSRKSRNEITDELCLFAMRNVYCLITLYALLVILNHGVEFKALQELV